MSPDPLIRGPFFLLLLLRYQKMVIIFSLDPRLLLMQNIVQSKYKPRFRNISLLLKSNQLHKKNNNIFFQADSQLLSSHNLITLDCHSFTSMTSWLSVGYRFSLKFVQPLHPHKWKTSFYLHNRWVIYLPTNFPPEKPLINLHEKWKKLLQQPCTEYWESGLCR